MSTRPVPSLGPLLPGGIEELTEDDMRLHPPVKRSVRWGDVRTVVVAPGLAAAAVTTSVTQFLDMAIEEPRLLRLRLEAVILSPPAGGLSLTWGIWFGGGAGMMRRDVAGTITTQATLASLDLDLPVDHIRVQATIVNMTLVQKIVQLSGHVAPWGYGVRGLRGEAT